MSAPEHSRPIRCISLTQPWASLVAFGEKRVETRSWTTSYRGPIAIQAAQTLPAWVVDLCRRDPFFKAALRRHGVDDARDLPRGAVVGTATLVAVHRTERMVRTGLSAQEIAFGDFATGRYGFVLEDARAIDPVTVRGRLGLFTIELPIHPAGRLSVPA